MNAYDNPLSRRLFLGGATAVAAATLLASYTSPVAVGAVGGPTAPGAELTPLPAAQGILDATDQFPLVALGEAHQLQEWHDFITALLLNPALPGKITDIVVEFGNARY